MATHILYLTSRCNFACDYCYERRGEIRDFVMDEQTAIQNISEMVREEGQTVIVLFGGEPTLNWDVLKKAAKYGFDLKKNVYFVLSTNGWRFRNLDFCKDYLEFAKTICNQICIDLSFDGIGNSKRLLKNGKDSTAGLYQVLKNFKKLDISFNIRYTVHRGNVDLVVPDLLNISKFLTPQKIVLSFDQSIDKFKVKTAIQKTNIQIPICDVTCESCRKCKRSEKTFYWTDKGNIRSLCRGENAAMFSDFDIF